MAVKLKTYGLDTLAGRVAEMQKDVDGFCEQALDEAAQGATLELFEGIDRHYRTGRTVSNLNMQPKVQHKGNRFFVKIGFNLPGGLPARFINKGTPTNRPDPFIDKATSARKIRKYYEQAFKRIMGG